MIQALLIYNGWGILVLRLALGIIFIAHGSRKLKNLKNTQAWFHSEGFKPGWFFGTLVTFSELLGGIAILLGFFMQCAALILTIVMLFALSFNVRKKKPLIGGFELDIILIAALLLLATLDNGYFALNSFFGLYW